MFEILQNLEITSRWVSPPVLFSTGIAAVIIGLILWLNGLNFKKIFISVIAAVTGFTCGLFIIEANLIVSLIIAAVAVSAALLFERAFISVLTALLIVIVSFIVLSRSYIDDSTIISTGRNGTPPEGQTISIRESVEKLKQYLINTSRSIKQIGHEMPFHIWVIIAVIASVSIVVGFIMRNLTYALCCSALGTLSIFAGMITLLLFKGAEPLSGISNKPLFYVGIIAVMTAFGTFEQLILCEPARPHTSASNPDSKNKNKSNRIK